MNWISTSSSNAGGDGDRDSTHKQEILRFFLCDFHLMLLWTVHRVAYTWRNDEWNDWRATRILKIELFSKCAENSPINSCNRATIRMWKIKIIFVDQII